MLIELNAGVPAAVSLMEAAVLCCAGTQSTRRCLGHSVLTELNAGVPSGTSCKPPGGCCVVLDVLVELQTLVLVALCLLVALASSL